MTREQCEEMIAQKIEEIRNIYREYNPNGKYLSIAIVDDGESNYYHFNNQYFDEESDDSKFKIDGFRREQR